MLFTNSLRGFWFLPVAPLLAFSALLGVVACTVASCMTAAEREFVIAAAAGPVEDSVVSVVEPFEVSAVPPASL